MIQYYNDTVMQKRIGAMIQLYNNIVPQKCSDTITPACRQRPVNDAIKMFSGAMERDKLTLLNPTSYHCI